MISVQNFFY